MKRSELKQIIKEQINSLLKESDSKDSLDIQVRSIVWAYMGDKISLRDVMIVLGPTPALTTIIGDMVMKSTNSTYEKTCGEIYSLIKNTLK